ncbi:mechanosensitive ion channel family protein [Accumulibacter sp.]|uniref:mechanosensitive ion channel family protein n=1 Tax=Accumulibacter sp. TaxID=2053492 RepID=UPI002631DA80|nr:mechanosensitive ion channel family protein [Accumulibacter sp.]
MDGLISKTVAYFWLPETKYVIAVFVAFALISWQLLPSERRRVGRTAVFFAVCLAGQFAGALFEAFDYSRLAVIIHETFVICSGFALFRLIGHVVFRIALPRVGIDVARIAEDIVLLGIYVAFIIARLHLIGLDPSSLLTTSALITAVLAFAMQDTLGNVLGGVALQLDNSLQTGDWVKLDDLTGRVIQIRWRQTTIRTRNGELVIVPNSQLMRGRFTLFGRDSKPEWPWRRWIWFNVTYDSSPTLVIQKVEKVISTAEIPNVAREPAPSCVLMEFGPGYARYALRYWMIDPQPDDPTDSAVRVHVFAALQRAGMQLAVPEQSVHVTKENEAYRESLRQREIEKRIVDLRKLELFAGLREDELRTISERMVYAPFARGAIIFEQGETAHWLYLLASGEAEVLIDFPGHPRQHFRMIHAGSTFGERGVMTGEPRRDTVIAKTDVVCYRLDQATVEEVVRSRPEIAEAIAHILWRREVEMHSFTRQFIDASASPPAPPKSGMLDKIREFLGL